AFILSAVFLCYMVYLFMFLFFFFFSSRRRHTRWPRDWSSDVCSSDLVSQRRKSVSMGLTCSNYCNRRCETSGRNLLAQSYGRPQLLSGARVQWRTFRVGVSCE